MKHLLLCCFALGALGAVLAFSAGPGGRAPSRAGPAFLEGRPGGIGEAEGQAGGRDTSRSAVPPEENRFVQTVYDRNLKEPMELDLLPDGRILFIERGGDLHVHDPEADSTGTIATLDVHTEHEDGLLGLALDPDYADNHWVYLFYSPSGEEPKQHVSRFRLREGRLDRASEKVLLEIPTDRTECCHSAGALEFGPQGNLFISVGDDTNPFASNGYAPIDEREGRRPWDAQRTSANTDDLRGKILRIHPERDGTYSIPAGNLFAEDGTAGRPEIYVMGNRNPFRLSIDAETGYLYWGEVGPDAGEADPARGPKGHDEVNQARGPGNFGWPYFVGDNKAYHDFDFADSVAGPAFDPRAPVNASPNSTGARTLPPAQPAFIWYPYSRSPEFPLVGEGSRNAMAGPVYHADAYEASGRHFPTYYDGKLFIYDWMRDWIMAVTMDENGDYEKMERLMPNTTFHNPVDMLFGPDGALYLLEYGSEWYAQNLDARLSRIDFVHGNRQPVARITADTTVGATPLTVQFSAAESVDFDGDALRYAWTFEREGGARGEAPVQSTEEAPTFTFEQPGLYKPMLTVTDAAGKSATAEMEILAGNAVPQVALRLEGNRTFFWEGVPLGYAVKVTDAEDGTLQGGGISPDQVRLSLDYLAEGYDLTTSTPAHQATPTAPTAMIGKELAAGSDCQACHQVEASSVGPSFRAVAKKYHDEDNPKPYLVEKIIEGGGGVWGDNAMAAHPQLTTEEAGQVVDYILSLAEDDSSAADSLPLEGTLAMDQHDRLTEEGRYILTASYTDRGTEAIGPLSARATVVLRPARVQAEAFDGASEAATAETISAPASDAGDTVEVLRTPDGGYARFDDIDLTGVGALRARLRPGSTAGGRLEVRLDAPDGPVIGTFDVSSPARASGFQAYTTRLVPTDGLHDLYVTFAGEGGAEAPVAVVDWFHFYHQSNPPAP